RRHRPRRAAPGRPTPPPGSLRASARRPSTSISAAPARWRPTTPRSAGAPAPPARRNRRTARAASRAAGCRSRHPPEAPSRPSPRSASPTRRDPSSRRPRLLLGLGRRLLLRTPLDDLLRQRAQHVVDAVAGHARDREHLVAAGLL